MIIERKENKASAKRSSEAFPALGRSEIIYVNQCIIKICAQSPHAPNGPQPHVSAQVSAATVASDCATQTRPLRRAVGAGRVLLSDNEPQWRAILNERLRILS